MTVNIATLAVKFVADTTGIKSGVSSVVSRVVSGAAAIYGFYRAVNAFATSADRIDKWSKVADRLGVSFNTIQDAALTAGLAGIELESLTDAIDKMSKKIGSGGMSLDKRFLEQADAIAAMVDPAEQAQKAMELFGKSGAKLLPLLKGGKNAFREASEFIKRFGLGISDIDAKNVERMNDSWTKLKTILSGTIDKITAQLAPSMGTFLDHTIEQLEHLGVLAKDFGFTWDSIGMESTKFFGALGDHMAFMNGLLLNTQATIAIINAEWLRFVDNLGTRSSSPERKNEIINESLRGLRLAEEGADLIEKASNNFFSNKIAREAADRSIERDKKRGAFGGIESRFAPGSADKGSQAAAKIINAGMTNLTAAEKAAIESARTAHEHKRATEKLLEWFRTKPPLILGVGNI